MDNRDQLQPKAELHPDKFLRYAELMEEYREFDFVSGYYELADAFGIDKPVGVDRRPPMTPDEIFQWAERVVAMEQKYQRMVGGYQLDHVRPEMMAKVQLNDLDLLNAQMSMGNMLARLIGEAQLAENPKAEPDDIARYRGGGNDLVESWVARKREDINARLDQCMDDDKARGSLLSELDAVKLVEDPFLAVNRTGRLLKFFQKAQYIQGNFPKAVVPADL